VPWAIGFNQRYYELVQPYLHNYVVDKTHSEDVRYVWIDRAMRKQASQGPSPRDVLALIRPWGRR
jgi:hypothetical protein